MEKIITIKNIMIEIMRNIHYIINNRAEEIEINVFTGYRSKTAIELDNLWSKYWTLAEELKAACLSDNTIYSGIISSIDKEAKLEKPVDETRVFLTIEDLEEVEAKAEEVTTVSKMDDNSMTIGSNKEDAEFWDLVDKTTTDKKMDLVSEVWGDLSSLYDEVVTPDDEVVIGENEYIDINKLTYESPEIWKPIKGYPYEVSTRGNVRIASIKQEVRAVTIMKGKKVVYLNGEWANLGELVYNIFIEGDCPEVIHMDNNIHNNHILNLKAA